MCWVSRWRELTECSEGGNGASQSPQHDIKSWQHDTSGPWRQKEGPEKLQKEKQASFEGARLGVTLNSSTTALQVEEKRAIPSHFQGMWFLTFQFHKWSSYLNKCEEFSQFKCAGWWRRCSMKEEGSMASINRDSQPEQEMERSQVTALWQGWRIINPGWRRSDGIYSRRWNQ